MDQFVSGKGSIKRVRVENEEAAGDFPRRLFTFSLEAGYFHSGVPDCIGVTSIWLPGQL